MSLEISSLSLHDALPICRWLIPIIGYTGNDPLLLVVPAVVLGIVGITRPFERNYDQSRSSKFAVYLDRKSTRLNSSHLVISYAVFCLKKKISHSYTLCLV